LPVQSSFRESAWAIGGTLDRDEIYARLPPWLQSGALSAYGLRLNLRRYGGGYDRLAETVFARRGLSHVQLHELQMQRLRETLEQAAAHVPYYRRLFRELGFSPAFVTTPAALRQLPILRRTVVQDGAREFISDGAGHMHTEQWKTSGTTGTGLVFPMSLAGEREQWALWWRYRAQFGVDRSTWYAHLLGRSVVPVEQQSPPFWRVNVPGHQVFFSGYHLSEQHLQSYVDELNRRRLPWVQGYPSLLAVLASYIIEAPRPLTYRPRLVTSLSETLLPHQEAVIERAFGVPCRQHYGTTEAVANISECPQGRLHVDEDFSFLEFVPTSTGAHEIVATGFANQAFPLIRYATGDHVTLPADDLQCSCGHAGRIVESIDGRIEDYVVTPTGARVGRMDHIVKDMVTIRECQIVQDSPGEIVFRVVKGQGYSAVDERRLIAETSKRLGADVQIRVEYVPELQRSRTGKLRFVVSSAGRNGSA